MNPADLLAKINALPDFSDDERAYLRQHLTAQKQYGLVWENKPEAVEDDLRHQLPLLVERAERFVETHTCVSPPDGITPDGRPIPIPFDEPSGDEGSNPCVSAQTTLPFGSEKSASLVDYHQSTNEADFSESVYAPISPQNHTLIEGDNLHALTTLNYTHAGRIDVIYIDPPYNTGNRDFKYNDHFVDREDSYRHSKWLSFMAKRLRLAKTLLKDTGVIFISIDDNEQAQLKLLCDEIFGEENFVANVIWQKNFAPRSSAKYFSPNHEYIKCYSKNISLLGINLLSRSSTQDDRYKNPDNDSRGVWTSDNLTARNYYSLGTYPVTNPAGRTIDGPPKGSYWRVSKAKLEDLIADKRIWFGANGAGVPRLKRFLSEVQDGVIPQTIWLHTEAGNTQEAKKEVLEIFGDDEGFFATPKPVKLLKRILQIGGSKNALVLDFFAGSGTTLHAVMALNAEDGGSRQCILVTNNENNIAEEVCYERNRRVIMGYQNAKGQSVPGLPGNALRYYQTAFVGRERTLANKRALMQQATALLCLKEGCYDEIAIPVGAIPSGGEPSGFVPSGGETRGIASLQLSENPSGGDHVETRYLASPRPDGTNPDGTNPDGTNPDGTNPDGTNPDGTNPDGTPVHSLSPNGRPVPHPAIRHFGGPGGERLLIVYDEDAIDDAVALIASWPDNEPGNPPIKVYVFAPSAYPYTDDFADVMTGPTAGRITLCALPEAIYQTYQRLLPVAATPSSSDDRS